jgi:hypothetical protein
VDVFTLLVGLGVVLALDVRAVDVDLRAGDGDFGAVGLFELDRAADLRRLRRGDHGEGGEEKRGEKGANERLGTHGRWSPAD